MENSIWKLSETDSVFGEFWPDEWDLACMDRGTGGVEMSTKCTEDMKENDYDLPDLELETSPKSQPDFHFLTNEIYDWLNDPDEVLRVIDEMEKGQSQVQETVPPPKVICQQPTKKYCYRQVKYTRGPYRKRYKSVK